MKSVFLNRPLDKEVHVVQPPGFKILDQEKKVLRLRKIWYGLKQVGCAWNKRTDNFLSQIDFVKCTSEHEVYLKVLKVVIVQIC